MEEEKKELTIEETVKKLTERLNIYEYLFKDLERRVNEMEMFKINQIRDDCLHSVNTLIQNISSEYINNNSMAMIS